VFRFKQSSDALRAIYAEAATIAYIFGRTFVGLLVAQPSTQSRIITLRPWRL
jgi:hypothetical protein